MHSFGARNDRHDERAECVRSNGRSAWQVFDDDLLTPQTLVLDAERKEARARGIELVTELARLLITLTERTMRSART